MNATALYPEKMEYRSDFLFEKVSFWDGFFSVFSLFSNRVKINASKTEEEADAKAMQQDWWMVWKDIYKAMQDFNEDKKVNHE